MACPFDARALLGRTFGEVLDEIAPGWALWGCGEKGPFAAPFILTNSPPRSEREIRAYAEITRKLALIVEALCEGAVELDTIDRTAVPLWVWASGRWEIRRNDNKRECLQVRTAEDQRVEYYIRRFREPAAEGSDKKSARSGKRGGGNTGYDDTAVVELARAELNKMTKPSKSGAAKAVIDRLIAEGHPVASSSTPEQWAARIARKL